MTNEILCPFQSRCWRYSYSVALLAMCYDKPPSRLEIFLSGYASVDMMPRKGIYAENMPFCADGVNVNLCPVLAYSDYFYCEEYKKEHRRVGGLTLRCNNYSKNPNARPRVFISMITKKAVAARDKYTCVYCGRSHNQRINGKKLCGVIDHFIPISLGGNEKSEDNLVFACSDCNQAKGNKIWERGCRKNYYQET